MSEDIADLPRLLNQPRRLSVSPLSIVRSFVRSGSLPNLASFHLFSFPSRRPFLRRSSIVFYHASIFSSFAAFLSLFSTTLPRIFPSLPLCVRVSTCTWVYVIYKCSISFSFSLSPLPSLCLRSLLERQPSAKEDGINAHGRLEKKKKRNVGVDRIDSIVPLSRPGDDVDGHSPRSPSLLVKRAPVCISSLCASVPYAARCASSASPYKHSEGIGIGAPSRTPTSDDFSGYSSACTPFRTPDNWNPQDSTSWNRALCPIRRPTATWSKGRSIFARQPPTLARWCLGLRLEHMIHDIISLCCSLGIVNR